MVALNGVLGASNIGSCVTRLCSVPSAFGISPGLARKASVMAFTMSGAACHIFNCWRIMLPMMSAMPFTGSTAIGELGAGLADAGLGAAGATSRGVGVTSYSALLIAMPAPPSTAAWWTLE